MYAAVTELKLKSGFTWSDKKEMNVNDDMKLAWNELVKVCEHLSSLSMTSNHYQGNKEYRQFTKSGWPHYEAMDQIMPSNARGRYAHYASQSPLCDFRLGLIPQHTSLLHEHDVLLTLCTGGHDLKWIISLPVLPPIST
jgi:hypothetical protein